MRDDDPEAGHEGEQPASAHRPALWRGDSRARRHPRCRGGGGCSVMSQAEVETVVSDLVCQLAGAAGVQFHTRVPVQLKGLEGEWLLHNVEWREGSGDEPERAAGVERGPAGSGLPMTLTSFVGGRRPAHDLEATARVETVMPRAPGVWARPGSPSRWPGPRSTMGWWCVVCRPHVGGRRGRRVPRSPTALGVSDEPGGALADPWSSSSATAPVAGARRSEPALDAVAEFVTRLPARRLSSRRRPGERWRARRNSR